MQSAFSRHAVIMKSAGSHHAVIMQSSAGNGLEVKLWKKTGRVCLVPRIVRGHQRSSVEVDLTGPSRAVDLG